MANVFVNFIAWSPIASVAIFSLIITLFINLGYKKFGDNKKMKELRERNKELMRLRKENVNDPKKLEEITKESMENAMQSFRLTVKPMLFTLPVILVIFYALSAVYANAATASVIKNTPLDFSIPIPLLGTVAGWFVWYMVFSLVFNFPVRKLLKM